MSKPRTETTKKLKSGDVVTAHKVVWSQRISSNSRATKVVERTVRFTHKSDGGQETHKLRVPIGRAVVRPDGETKEEKLAEVMAVLESDVDYGLDYVARAIYQLEANSTASIEAKAKKKDYAELQSEYMAESFDATQGAEMVAFVSLDKSDRESVIDEWFDRTHPQGKLPAGAVPFWPDHIDEQGVLGFTIEDE